MTDKFIYKDNLVIDIKPEFINKIEWIDISTLQRLSEEFIEKYKDKFN